MKYFYLLLLLLCFTSLPAAERKNIKDVVGSELTQDSQRFGDAGGGIDLVWWIPLEFWQQVMTNDQNVSQQQVDDVIEVVRPYSHIAIVQANVSKFGAFKFLSRNEIRDGLRVKYRDGEGQTKVLAPMEEVDPDLEILLGQMRPVLGAAIGNLGQNLFFYTFDDKGSDGRLISPYEKGELIVQLAGRNKESPTEFVVETPLNSLFVPRICPNGKPAHVSWTHCPWDGSKLEP